MVLDPIPQPLPVHFFGSRPQPFTSLWLLWLDSPSHDTHVRWVNTSMTRMKTSLTRMNEYGYDSCDLTPTRHVTHVPCVNTSMTRMNEYEYDSYDLYSYEPCHTCAMCVTHVRSENTNMARMNSYAYGAHASYSYEPSSTCATWENGYDSYEWNCHSTCIFVRIHGYNSSRYTYVDISLGLYLRRYFFNVFTHRTWVWRV